MKEYLKTAAKKALELISERNNRLSHTKIIALTGGLTMVWGFGYEVFWRGLTPQLLLAFAVAVGLLRYASAKAGKEHVDVPEKPVQ